MWSNCAGKHNPTSRSLIRGGEGAGCARRILSMQDSQLSTRQNIKLSKPSFTIFHHMSKLNLPRWGNNFTLLCVSLFLPFPGLLTHPLLSSQPPASFCFPPSPWGGQAAQQFGARVLGSNPRAWPPISQFFSLDLSSLHIQDHALSLRGKDCCPQ